MKTTARQREVLSAIKRLTAKLGMPPSLRELSDELDFGSPCEGIKYHLDVLRRKGLVTWEPNRCRTLRVVEKRGIPIAGTVS